jgi:hypothetical protein
MSRQPKFGTRLAASQDKSGLPRKIKRTANEATNVGETTGRANPTNPQSRTQHYPVEFGARTNLVRMPITNGVNPCSIM